MIRWPYKYVVGFPGDARHVSWTNESSTTPTCEVRNPNDGELVDRFGLGICTVEKPCLFNLEKDPLELDNLLNGHMDESIMMQSNGVPTTHFDGIHR